MKTDGALEWNAEGRLQRISLVLENLKSKEQEIVPYFFLLEVEREKKNQKGSLTQLRGKWESVFGIIRAWPEHEQASFYQSPPEPVRSPIARHISTHPFPLSRQPLLIILKAAWPNKEEKESLTTKPPGSLSC